MAKNTIYTTVVGDRWDTIAQKAWGDCTQDQIDKLKKANPYETTKEVFAAGVDLNVPILEDQIENIDKLLPAWKRTTPDVSSALEQSTKSFDNSFDESFG